MQISDAEWIVMNLIWQSQPVDASQVIERLAKANGWSAATVKTMLHRLVKKGALPVTQAARFQRVRVIEAPVSNQWRIQLPNGVSVAFAGEVDARTLSTVLGSAAAIE